MMPARAALLESEDNSEGVVDVPELLRVEPSDSLAEPLGIHGTNLLDEDPRRLSFHRDLGPKRGRASALRRRSNEHDRAREKLICLHKDAVSDALLLVP